MSSEPKSAIAGPVTTANLENVESAAACTQQFVRLMVLSMKCDGLISSEPPEFLAAWFASSERKKLKRSGNW